VKRFPAWLALIVFASPAVHAQQSPSDTSTVRSATISAVVTPTARMTKRILLLVDASGSMNGQIGPVINSVIQIAAQPVDEMELAVMTFRSPHDWKGSCGQAGHGGQWMCGGNVCSWRRWSGFRRPNLPRGVEPAPRGWAKLPSQNAIDSAVAWVREIGSGGGTDPKLALQRALHEPLDDLSIVLVSDGQWTQAPVLVAVEAAQKWRVKNGFKRALIATFGIGTTAHGQDSMKELAEAGGGGFYAPVPCTSRPH